MQEFGYELCKIRTGKNLTQRQVARADVHLSAASISRIERGEHSPSLDQLEAFARVLRVRFVILGTEPTRVTQ